MRHVGSVGGRIPELRTMHPSVDNKVWERCRAVRMVASLADTVGEAVEVLDMLGLDPKEART